MSTVNKARILHTSDWQLGMTRWFLDEDAQARFDDARLASIKNIFAEARERQCDAIVVAGDVFDSNIVKPRNFRRAIEELKSAPAPVYLLPGNHDPYDQSSIYRSEDFKELANPEPGKAPVIVLTDETVHTVPNREDSLGDLCIIGAPLLTKKVDEDLVSGALDSLEADTRGATIRVLVGHGPTKKYSDSESVIIDVEKASRSCESRLVDYVALGDTHSAESLDSLSRVWYSGAPEVTDFREPDGGGESNSGKALIVDISVDPARPGEMAEVEVEEISVGSWVFQAMSENVNSLQDVQYFIEKLNSISGKSETVIRYSLKGVINHEADSYLNRELQELKPVFGALYQHDRYMDLQVVADEEEIDSLIAGDAFIKEVVTRLQEEAENSSDSAAKDAFKLLYRLSQRNQK